MGVNVCHLKVGNDMTILFTASQVCTFYQMVKLEKLADTKYDLSHMNMALTTITRSQLGLEKSTWSLLNKLVDGQVPKLD